MLNHYIFTCDELCIHLHTLSDGGIPQGFNWEKKDNFILYIKYLLRKKWSVNH